VDAEYKASITSRPFLFNETVILAEFLLDGIDTQEIERRVVEENLFQVQSVHSRRFTFGVVMRRLKHAPSELLGYLAHGEPKLARLANLYLMLREFRLLREISAELLADNLLLFDDTLSQGEVERFLEHKRDQSDVIAGWSEKTFQKVRRNTMRVFVDAGLLEGRGPWRITPPFVPEALRQFLRDRGEEEYLRLMLDSVRP
jgi:Putative inner membrane protein (DUF1819)